MCSVWQYTGVVLQWSAAVQGRHYCVPSGVETAVHYPANNLVTTLQHSWPHHVPPVVIPNCCCIYYLAYGLNSKPKSTGTSSIIIHVNLIIKGPMILVRPIQYFNFQSQNNTTSTVTFFSVANLLLNFTDFTTFHDIYSTFSTPWSLESCLLLSYQKLPLEIWDMKNCRGCWNCEILRVLVPYYF